MGRSIRRGRIALGLAFAVILAVVIAGGQARATAGPTISSISTLGSTAVQETANQTTYTLYVPSNHSGDASELVGVDAVDSSNVFFLGPNNAPVGPNNSGTSVSMSVNSAAFVWLCPHGTASATDPSCVKTLLELERTTTNDNSPALITTSPTDIGFNGNTTSNTDYSIRVSGSTSQLSVNVQAQDTQAGVTISGSGGTGTASKLVSLNAVGQTTDIPIVITAVNASQMTITIHVSRGATDADLSNLTINPGTLTPGFSSGTLSYTDTVASGVSTVGVTPTNTQNGTSVISVGGDTVADPTAIPLSDTNPTHIVITSNAEDPNSTPAEVYSIDVTRHGSEQLTVNLAGTGHGTVTSTAPDDAISCATADAAGCSTHYDDGTSVTLSESPATGSIFAGWSNDCGGSDTTTSFDMPMSAATCTATFTALGAAQTRSPFTVNTTDDGDYGGCYANLCTLRAALDAASNGGTVKFSVDHVDLSSSIEYAPAKTLTIDGGAGSGVTIDNSGLSFDAGTITLKNLLVEDGAGVYFAGGSATLTDFKSEHNSSDEGAGVFFNGTKLTMTGGDLESNDAGACGGLDANSGTVTLTNVVITGNSAEDVGGGMCVSSDATVSMTGGFIAGNGATDGGGVFDVGAFTASNTSFVENLGEEAGAAIEVDVNGTATITNSTFTANPFFWTVQNDGTGEVALVNSTLADNGGGISGDVTLLNTLLAGNSDGGNCGSAVNSLGHNVDDDGTCAISAPGDVSNVDARVGDMTGDFTFPLLNGSPALDAGTKTGAPGLTVPTKDAVGTARPQGGGIDIGAMEMPEHKLTIKIAGNGSVADETHTTTGGWYVAGSTVHLTATPDEGGPAFGKWSGACTGTDPGADVVISGDVTCTATFVDPPTITSFAPTHGRIRSTVTITGTHLDGVTSVAFGETTATIKSATATKLVVTVPDGVGTDAVAINVTNAAASVGSDASFMPDWPAPSITSFTPKSAKAGATLTLTGRDFLGVTGVTFNGGATADIFGTPTDTKLQVIVPDNAETGQVTVQTPGGADDSPTDFTFLPPPTITAFTEAARFGETVTIFGHDLASTTGVTINGVTVKPSTRPADTIVTIVVPSTADAGSAPIVVTNSGGSTPTTDNFTLDWWTPVVTSVSPTSARPGSTITITGQHFTRAAAVEFGSGSTDAFKVVSDTKITATVPLTVGGDPVFLGVLAGDESTDSNRDVTFTPLWPQPRVTSFSPAAAAAGKTVTINGSNFLGVTAVKFNGHDATITDVPTDKKLTVTVPDSDGASGPISVTTQGATPTGTSSNPFLFLSKPENLTVDNNSGAVGDAIKISGDFLGTTKAVTFNGHAAKFKIAADKASVTATVPDADDVGGTISVTNAGGTADVPGDPFTQTYNVPTITSFTPSSGLVGSTITITGTGFRGTLQAKLGIHPASYFAVSDTKLTMTVPFGAELTKDTLSVHTAGGTATSVQQFTPKWPKPTIKSFTPLSSVIGGVVTINGTNFVDVTAVAIGGQACDGYDVVSKTQITCTVAVGTQDGKKITVTNNAGTATSAKSLALPRD